MFTHTKNCGIRLNRIVLTRCSQKDAGNFRGTIREISVAMQYLFQGWNTRGNEKYKDLLMDTATEEIGHVEMIATMIARLLEDAPLAEQEKAADDPVIGSILGGMNPHHAIVSGLGAMPESKTGVPWSAGYIVASGNLLADFRANLNAESQGRLQVARLYEMTDDKGVKDMLSFYWPAIPCIKTNGLRPLKN